MMFSIENWACSVCKGKGNVIAVRAMKLCSMSGGIAPVIFDLSTRLKQSA